MSNNDEIKGELFELEKYIIFSEPFELLPNDKLKLWKLRFGEMSPKAVYSILSQNCQNMQVLFSSSCLGDIILKYDDGLNHGQSSFIIREPLSEASRFELSSMDTYGENNAACANGAGTAKIVLQNLLRLTDICYPNIRYIDISAYDVGSYAWLKFGFLPYPSNKGLKKEASFWHKYVKDQLSVEANTSLNALLNEGNPKNFWAIADMQKSVTVTSQCPSDDYRHPGDTMKLGKYLLLSNDWTGYLDLTDPESRMRLTGYLALLSTTRGIRLAGRSNDGAEAQL